MVKDELGNRIKSNYENRAKTYLTRRTPVIIRIDGRAFHTLTKRFIKPFDDLFGIAMMRTAKSLCSEISGAQGAYTQSDEISLLLQDYSTFQTDAWFDYQVQKLASVAAGLATMYFNKHFTDLVKIKMGSGCDSSPYENKNGEILMGSFDARCFNLPKEEVNNYFVWRQQDAAKNSVQMLARSLFSHKEIQGLNLNQMQTKMFIEKKILWENLDAWKKWGSFIRRGEDRKWIIDKDIPIFSSVPDYINRLVYIGDTNNEE